MSSGQSRRGAKELGRILGDRSPAGLYVASPRGALLDCNQAFAELLGYRSREEALAAGRLLLGSGAAHQARRRGAPAIEIESCLTRRDGVAIRVVRTETVTESRGEQLVVGALVDVTRARRSGAQQRELEEHLHHAHKMEAVGRLAGGIAHDYNNLLAVILSYTSLVMEELGEQSHLRKDLAEIQRAAQRAAALTRQLLTVSRKGRAAPAVLDLRTVVAEMETSLRPVLGEGVELDLSIGASSCRVLADVGHLQHIVMNLALNARDAMPTGGRLRIEARAVHVGTSGRLREAHPALPPGKYARLAVADTGSGMSEDVRARAFEPFFTTKPRGKGTGLGLATVYGIVKQSHGHIEIASWPGEGTRVEIYLPLVPRAAPQKTSRSPAAPRRRAGGTVLVTDDEDAVLTLASRILSQHGYTTLTASGPHEALRVSERQRGAIDLLLTDVLMPGMSGKDLATRLVARRPDMKVLYMSGYTGDALCEAGIAGGASVALLEKPFTAESLLGCVRRALE